MASKDRPARGPGAGFWRRLAAIRRIVAWGLLVLLCLALAWPEDLIGVARWLPKLQFGQMAAALFSGGTGLVWPTAVLAASTLLLGRWFCGWICPLGASMDLAVAIGSKLGRNRFGPRPDRWWRAIIPAAAWAAFWLGFSEPLGLLEPYSVVASGPLVWLLATLWAARRGRSYCDGVCPAGWLLKLVSGPSPLGLRLDQAGCAGCGACQKVCPVGCLDPGSGRLDRSRCVLCLACAGVCPKGALRLGPARRAAGAAPPADSAGGRRAFLRLAGAAAFFGGAAATGEGARLAVFGPPSEVPILPPGALSLAHMGAHCTGCQTCVRACPNEAINSAWGPPSIMGKPVLDPYRGFCQYDCVLCGRICPTGALVPLSPEAKRLTRLGWASLDRPECLVVKQGNACGACAELCPTGAVSMLPGPSGRNEPTLQPEYCIGCGACQKACPVRPVSAIVVRGLLVHQTAKAPIVEITEDAVLGDDFPF